MKSVSAAKTAVSSERRQAAAMLTLQQNFENELAADIGKKKRQETCQRPAHGHAAAPPVKRASSQQGAEDDPRQDAEYRLVRELHGFAEQFFREKNSAGQRKGQQHESREDDPEQKMLHGQQR